MKRMDLKPEDILEVDFNRSFRGYSEAEVREFLEEVAAQWEKLLAEREKILQENRELRKRLAEREEYVRRIDVQMEEWKKQLEIEKALAKKEVAMIQEEAERKAQRVVEEALNRKRDIEKGYSELLEKYRLFRIRFRSLLQTFLESIEWKNQAWEEMEEKGEKAQEKQKEEVVRFSLKDFKDEIRVRKSER